MRLGLLFGLAACGPSIELSMSVYSSLFRRRQTQEAFELADQLAGALNAYGGSLP
jgi:hypothetical protein